VCAFFRVVASNGRFGCGSSGVKTTRCEISSRCWQAGSGSKRSRKAGIRDRAERRAQGSFGLVQASEAFLDDNCISDAERTQSINSAVASLGL
jgi:hypothetical protein